MTEAARSPRRATRNPVAAADRPAAGAPQTAVPDKLAGIQGGNPADAANAVVVNGTVYIGGFDQQLHAFALP